LVAVSAFLCHAFLSFQIQAQDLAKNAALRHQILYSYSILHIFQKKSSVSVKFAEQIFEQQKNPLCFFCRTGRNEKLIS